MFKPARTDRVIEALPVVLPVLRPADFVDTHYIPALLLPVSFDVSIVRHPEYQQALEVGFQCFSSDDEYGTIEEVKNFLDDELTTGFELGLSLPWTTGLMHGWLSALALVDAGLAAQGVQALVHLVETVSSPPAPSSPSYEVPASAFRFCGPDGWSLDL
jgi:hypothetical protein